MGAAPSFPEKIGRFLLRERIGQGSMGLVYRATDTATGREVALKTLRFFEPDDLYRLKREFRVLSGLTHPNLIRLYDLVVTDEHSFFTMELVDGCDFVHFVRAGAQDGRNGDGHHGFDARRLRSVLRQLVGALEELHRSGKLHRDIKPGNVLVGRDGRVVLMDFDLVGAMPTSRSLDSQAGLLVGTLAYMAPEQLRGLPPTAASDFYGVGVMLYEALTGRLPFEQLFDAVQRTEAPALPDEANGIPDDLRELVRSLLAPAAAERPTASWIREILDDEREAESGPVPPDSRDDRAAPDSFFGRDAERARLADLLVQSRNEGHTVLLEGVSGIGKTALIEELCASAELGHGALVLKGRCHPHESVPFRAVDALVDELARFMSRQAPEYLDSVMPRRAAALARVFPVLCRVATFAEAARHGLAGAEPHEVLRRALEGFRELLSRLAERQPVVFWIDDLQWGDLDSIEVLRALQRRPDAPRLLIVLSFRAEDREASGVLQTLLARTREDDPRFTTSLAIGPLSEDETRQLARRMLDGNGSGDSAARVEAVVRNSGGSPFFAAELARDARTAPQAIVAARSLRDVLLARVSRLPAEERRLLESIAIAGCPIDEEIAGRAASVAGLDAVLHRLQRESLLRVASTTDRRLVGCYHDRIREAVVDALDDGQRRELHLSLARTLEATPESDPQLLVDHYLLANERTSAAGHAYLSAQKAASALAFHRAASLYRQALELGATDCPRWQLHAHLAETLVNAGYGSDAAQAFLAAADGLAESGGDRFDVLHLRRCAAEQYLRSGFVDEGISVMREVLGSLGLVYHDNANRALLSLLVGRLRFSLASRFGRRPEAKQDVPREVRARMDALWSAGLGISDFEAVRAFDFQMRHALLALKAGDPAHLSRALATEALILAMEAGPRTARRISEARVEGERLAFASGDSQAQAHAMLMSAGVAFFDHRYGDALVQCERGVVICRDHCTGVAWELANLQYFAAYSLAYLGEIARLQERLPEILTRAAERGDRFALTYCRIGLLMLSWLARDRPAEGRAELEDAMHGRTPSKAPWQYHLSVYGAVHVDLYENKPGQARERSEAAWRLLRKEQMLRLEGVRVEQRVIHARSLVACALDERGGPAMEKLLAEAEKEARRILRERGRWAPALAASVLGGIAAVRGDVETATSQLGRAAVGFDTLGMALHAAAARYQRNRLGGGSDAADPGEWMQQQGILEPARIAAMLSPGVR